MVTANPDIERRHLKQINRGQICPYCGSKTEYVDGTVIYPHRPDLANRKFYICRPCNAYVGCHKPFPK